MLSHGHAGDTEYFQGSLNTLGMIRMNTRRRIRINRCQLRVNIRPTMFISIPFNLGASGGVSLWHIRQPL